MVIIAIAVGAAWRAFRGFSGSSGAPVGIGSVAVLPLSNLSANAGQDYVVDGLHEALISELSKIGALRVMSRTSTLRFKTSNRSIPEIGRELGVDAVIEGSVLRSGNHLRVSTQLLQANPERRLWGDQFDRELTDVLYLTSDVAQAVAREIRITLSPAERARLTRARPVESAAYEWYAVGRHYWDQRTIDDYKRAIESFQKSLALDAGFAPAHAALSDVYMILGEQGGLPQKEARARAIAAIEKALALDENLAEAHASLGHWKFYYDWNWPDAERSFRHAIELNPSYAVAHQMYGRSLGFVRRYDDALRELQRARELDPLSIPVRAYTSQVYIFSRQYARAAEELRSAVELDPNHALVRHNLGELYLAQGRFTDAIPELERSLALSRERSAHFVAMLGCAYARGNRRRDALGILEDLTRQSRLGRASAFDIASLQMALGDQPRALATLESGYRDRDVWMIEVDAWPWFDQLRGDARFQALLRSITNAS
jgi:TolB-like protein/Tfp pilus assembly protein PilF